MNKNFTRGSKPHWTQDVIYINFKVYDIIQNILRGAMWMPKLWLNNSKIIRISDPYFQKKYGFFYCYNGEGGAYGYCKK